VSEKKRIFSALHRHPLPAGNHDFRQLLSHLAQTALGKGSAEADAFADVNFSRYWNWLKRELDDQAARGLTPFFSLSPAGTYAVSSACEALALSSNADEALRGNLARARPYVLREIDKLSDREYEALACVACTTAGSLKTHLTPPGNEGGIDFIATLSIHTSNHILSSKGAEIRIVGQCKKYSSPVTVDKLDQFLTTMNNVRHRSDRVRRHLPPWFEESRGPIVGWVVSHSGFQVGASDEAKNHGVILSDSVDMAELVSLAQTFHAAKLPNERASQLLDACRALL
jgi:hypothetical protein